MAKSRRKKAKLSDWIGLIFWTGVFYLVVLIAVRYSAPTQKDPGYVQFPTDEELKKIETN